MAITSLITSLVSDLLKDWWGNRQKINKAKIEARIKNVSEGIPGYSDEFLILIWAAPFVLCFIPGSDVWIKNGFDNFSQLPDWYVGGFISISFAVFGIDKIFKWKK